MVLDCPWLRPDDLANYVAGRIDWQKIVEVVNDDFNQLFSLLKNLENAKKDYTITSGKYQFSLFIISMLILD